ncbi:hypothetical protein LCGC14_2000410, partial [marine sediment metagenome]
MVEYSEKESLLLDQCLGFYRREIYPDGPIDRDDSKVVIAALDYAHSLGKFIRTIPIHNTMHSILAKHGVVRESNEHRQVRLKAERLEKIRLKRMGSMDAEVEAAQIVLAKAQAKKKFREAQVNAAKKDERIITVNEENARKAQLEAETRAKLAEDNMKSMQKQINEMKTLMQMEENGKALKETA